MGTDWRGMRVQSAFCHAERLADHLHYRCYLLLFLNIN